ncbi:hypothetical protein RRG08_030020 [Elysia crispata]|uniref:Uncharacterized protein n=1 Tax=Elysia crispata TaxID=231223 RepID=A0AAE0XZA5_9GAST|nr:hypothetical protein RRG08_030020 [Elysia crispata]
MILRIVATIKLQGLNPNLQSPLSYKRKKKETNEPRSIPSELPPSDSVFEPHVFQVTMYRDCHHQTEYSSLTYSRSRCIVTAIIRLSTRASRIPGHDVS